MLAIGGVFTNGKHFLFSSKFCAIVIGLKLLDSLFYYRLSFLTATVIVRPIPNHRTTLLHPRRFHLPDRWRRFPALLAATLPLDSALPQ